MPPLNQIVVTVVANGQQYVATMKQMGAVTQQAANQMAAATNKATAANTEADKSTKSLTSRLVGMGKEVVGNIVRFTAYYLAVQQVISVVGGAVGEFRELDAALRNIQSLTLESDDAIQGLGESLIAMVFAGASAGAKSSELAKAMYELVSAGYSTSEALGLVKIAAVGAAAGLSTTDTVAKALLSILQSYKLPVEDASSVMNQLFVIVDKGVLSFDDLVTNLGYVIPTAAAMGISLNEVGAAIELLTRQGQQPSRVMTNLNDVMTRLLKPNKELAQAIHDLGYASGTEMVKTLGFVGTVQALGAAAEDTSRGLKMQSDALYDLTLAQKGASLSLEDAVDAESDIKKDIKETQEEMRKAGHTTKERAALTERLSDQQRSLRRAHLGVTEAERGLAKATDAVSSAQDTMAMTTEDADDTLAKWFGDVRAIRAILPLAANDGQDFVDMLAEHNKEAEAGDRHEKAFQEQMKSLNFQLKQASSNIIAFVAVMLMPFKKPVFEILNMFNQLFHGLATFDEKTGKWGLNMEKLASAVKIAWAAVIYIVGIFAAMFFGPFAAIPFVIVSVLVATGNLGKAFELLKTIAVTAFTAIKKALEDLAHFFKLGLGGGAIGGEHSPFEKLAFGIGKSIREAIPHIKAFIALIQQLAHLFTLGFSGGEIGGSFSGIEKAAFEVGQVLRKIIDFIISEAIPAVAKAATEVGQIISQIVSFIISEAIPAVSKFFGDVLVKAFEIVKGAFNALKGMIEDIAKSPSFNAFLNYVVDRFNAWVHIIGEVVTAIYKFLQTPLGQTLLDIGKYILIAVAAFAFFSTGIGEVVAIIAIVVAAIYILTNVIDFLVKLFHTCKDAVSDTWKTITDFANDVAAKFTGILSSIGDFVGGIIDTIAETPKRIAEAAEGMFNAGKSFMQRFFDGASDVISGAVNGAGDIAGKVVSAIKDHILKPAMRALDVAIPNNIDAGPVHIGLPDNPINDVVGYESWAKGVRDWMGGLALVGENGPEFAVLPRGTSVATAPKTSRIMDNLAGGGGGGLNFTANFNVAGATIDEIIKCLYQKVDELDRQMRFRAVRAGTSLNGRLA